MADSGDATTKGDGQIDWTAMRSLARSTIRARLGHAEPALVEDLTQQTMIEMLRVQRREELRNPGGVARVLARNVSIDHIRRQQRERRRATDWESHRSEINALANPQPARDGSDEMLWFLLLEYLRTNNPPCHALALAFADLGDWKRVTQSMNLGYDATRQKWSRCIREFRARLKRDPGLFREWLDDA